MVHRDVDGMRTPAAATASGMIPKVASHSDAVITSSTRLRRGRNDCQVWQ